MVEKMYLSYFEVDKNIKRHKDFDIKVPKLLEELKNHSVEIVYLKDFVGYDRIEKTISDCDSLLAIVDEYWLSSTWKANEVTYANGDGGTGATNNPRIQRKPVFIFPVYENIQLSFLERYKGAIILPSGVEEAVKSIISRLRGVSSIN